MKSLKNVLAALAFVFAFGAALATNASDSLLVTKFGETINGCEPGTLEQPLSDCAVTAPTQFGRCTVQIGFSTGIPAYDDQNTCNDELWRQK